MKRKATLAGLAAALVLAGCATYPDNYSDTRYYEPRYGYASAPPPAYVAYSDYGRVVAIDVVRGSGSGIGGAVVGGIVGGVLGHQIGSGRGNDAATAAGAIGGALAGREIDRRNDEHFRITVELRDGRTATFVQDSLDGIRVGDPVRLADNRLYRN